MVYPDESPRSRTARDLRQAQGRLSGTRTPYSLTGRSLGKGRVVFRHEIPGLEQRETLWQAQGRLRGTRPRRDDKKQRVATAHLKVRPFRTCPPFKTEDHGHSINLPD